MPAQTATKADRLASVFEQLLVADELTISEIAEATSLSRPTVRSLLDILADDGLAASHTPPESTTVGRPASHWRLPRRSGFVVAVDLLPRSALVVTARLNGTVLSAARVDVAHLDRAARLDEVTRLLEAAITSGGDFGPARAIVLSNTGTVDDRGRVLESIFVPAWNGLELGTALTDRLGLPVHVENDINCAACGEFTLRVDQGALAPDSDLLFVRVHEGLVTGLVLGGRIHRGVNFTAGEFGLRFGEVGGDEVPRLAEIAASIGSMAALLDPSVIVVSPSVRTPRPLEVIRAKLAERLPPSVPMRPLEESRLGQAAAVTGALALALADARTGLAPQTRPARYGPTDDTLIRLAAKDERHTI